MFLTIGLRQEGECSVSSDFVLFKDGEVCRFVPEAARRSGERFVRGVSALASAKASKCRSSESCVQCRNQPAAALVGAAMMQWAGCGSTVAKRELPYALAELVLVRFHKRTSFPRNLAVSTPPGTRTESQAIAEIDGEGQALLSVAVRENFGANPGADPAHVAVEQVRVQ